MSNNLNADIWGPFMWTAIHSITYGYPENPTREQKEDYKQFFTLLGKVLPCCTCRNHYENHLHEQDLQINDKVFENRKNLSNWGYNLHNCVNISLGKSIYPKNLVDEKYEEMRILDGGMITNISNNKKIKRYKLIRE